MSAEIMRLRGDNQSTDTKLGTTYVCEAREAMLQGRIGLAATLLDAALARLPDINTPVQMEAEVRHYAPKGNRYA